MRMMLGQRKYKGLEKSIGFKFKNQDLLELALTHASVRSSQPERQDNERLEFIGDRVLGLAIAEFLNTAYPEAREGDLARHYNRLVRGETCARVGREIDIGQYLILSQSEDDSGGRDKETIIADAVEALLAAVFLDVGYEKAKAVVLRLWQHHCSDLPKAKATVDAKSALQEWAQAKGLALPKYVEVTRTGPDHAPFFTTEVQISGKQPGRGEGTSKRAAEQDAATSILRREGVWMDTKNG